MTGDFALRLPLRPQRLLEIELIERPANDADQLPDQPLHFGIDHHDVIGYHEHHGENFAAAQNRRRRRGFPMRRCDVAPSFKAGKRGITIGGLQFSRFPSPHAEQMLRARFVQPLAEPENMRRIRAGRDVVAKLARCIGPPDGGGDEQPRRVQLFADAAQHLLLAGRVQQGFGAGE